jgi:hypothetical protein
MLFGKEKDVSDRRGFPYFTILSGMFCSPYGIFSVGEVW